MLAGLEAEASLRLCASPNAPGTNTRSGAVGPFMMTLLRSPVMRDCAHAVLTDLRSQIASRSVILLRRVRPNANLQERSAGRRHVQEERGARLAGVRVARRGAKRVSPVWKPRYLSDCGPSALICCTSTGGQAS